MINVIVYKQAGSDKIPFKEWLKDLDRAYEKRIIYRLDRIKTGNLGDFKNLGEGVMELRFSFGSGYRIYLARMEIS